MAGAMVSTMADNHRRINITFPVKATWRTTTCTQ
jgi:hypothetical protein